MYLIPNFPLQTIYIIHQPTYPTHPTDQLYIYRHILSNPHLPYHCIFKRYMYLNYVNTIVEIEKNGWVAEVKESGEQKQKEWNQTSKLKKFVSSSKKMVLFFHEVLHSLRDVLISHSVALRTFQPMPASPMLCNIIHAHHNPLHHVQIFHVPKSMLQICTQSAQCRRP